MQCIYLDNNATTPMLPAVWEAMRPIAVETFGNAASAHREGRRARQALEDARERVAAILDAFPDEVIFTSGATEANNLALFGVRSQESGVRSQGSGVRSQESGVRGQASEVRCRILTSPIEHPSVAEPIQQLEHWEWVVDRVPVDHLGVIRTDVYQSLIYPETGLVSIMLANNETGTVQPIGELATLLQGRAYFHCDAVQAVGKQPVLFHELGVTSLSLSAHKFHGPKGVGALLLRRGVKLRPLIHGGHQQRGRRPGTEPVALAVGLATALELAHKEADQRRTQVARLRSRFLKQLRESSGPVVINGPEEGGILHTLNLSFPGCRADSLLMNLDLAGVACSTGSACSSGSLLPSPVLQAMGIPAALLHSAMRFSLSHLLSVEQVEEAARRIAEVVARLRGMENE